MNALISIDYTYDFAAEDEKLATDAAGQAIRKKLTAHTKKFMKQKDFVIFVVDAHDPKDSFHSEDCLFPPHNVIETSERELYGPLKNSYQDHGQQENVYWIDRWHYSTFSGIDLDIRLRERQIADAYLSGVCTDICALHIAVDAYNLGYKLHIFEDTVASFDPAGHEWVSGHFESALGAKIL